MKEILNVIHNTIYQFIDVCNDAEEVPMSDKDKLLLEVNKAICNNLKALEQQPFINKPCVAHQICHEDKIKMIDKIRAEIEKVVWEDVIVSLDGTDEVRIPRLEPDDVFEIINKYKAAESEE